MDRDEDGAQLAEEVSQYLAGQALMDRFVAALKDELMDPARELFGDRAVPWIASTLRTTAELLERMGDGGRFGA